MRNANSQNEPTELTDVLKEWEAPNGSASLDHRVMASYRQHINRVPFWRRFFTTSIAVPLPLVIIQALLFLVAGGAVIAFFQARDRQAMPLAQAQRQIEMASLPTRQETSFTFNGKLEKKRIRSRQTPRRAAMVALPVSAIINSPGESFDETASAPSHPETQTAGLPPTPEALVLTAAAPVHKLDFAPTLNFKAKFPDPLKFDFSYAQANEFVFEAPSERSGDGRIVRTILRASNWVTKPLEKGAGLYRAIPRTIPTINSFIAPAKDACLAPFRSAPVNVQIN